MRHSRIDGKTLIAARPIARGEVLLSIGDSVVIAPDDPDFGTLIGGDRDPYDYLLDGAAVVM